MWRVFFIDLMAITLAVAIAQKVRFGNQHWQGSTAVYATVSTAIALLWLAALALLGTYDRRIIGRGVIEYRRVVAATFWLFGGIAVLSIVLALDLARGYLAVALPLGLMLLLIHRSTSRAVMRRQRRSGRVDTCLMVLGGYGAASSTVHNVLANPQLGYRVVGVCLQGSGEDTEATWEISGTTIPVRRVVDGREVVAAAKAAGADTLALTDSHTMSAAQIRDLGWALHEQGIGLVVSSLVRDYGGQRMQVSLDGDLPLMLVDQPSYRSPWRILKPVIGQLSALLGTVALIPALLAIAAAVKLEDGGPVFYRQVRVGKDGREFRMWKFRSMFVDADARLAQYRAERDDQRAFFKDEDDPRITRTGRFLRATSLDELPQLFNVIAGQMSLVGPRPMVPGEGAEFEGFVQRRLLVRPGMTGLWQVSGRSDLSEDQRVRLDLAYVENYSLVQDMMILTRTLRAVLKREGAY